MQTNRNRLIELIGTVQSIGVKYTHEETASSMGFRENEELADYLLANGVIVPPCKVGDSIFRVGNGEIWEWLIEHIEIFEDEIGFVDDGENYFTPDKIGKIVFLTKEEAKEKLRGLNNGNKL